MDFGTIYGLSIGIEAVSACLLLALTVYFHLRYDSNTVNFAPSLLMILGIFITFILIAVGILQFNSTNIETSVPKLLNAMKHAFWTTLMGILGGVSIKLRAWWLKRNASQAPALAGATGATPALAAAADEPLPPWSTEGHEVATTAFEPPAAPVEQPVEQWSHESAWAHEPLHTPSTDERPPTSDFYMPSHMPQEPVADHENHDMSNHPSQQPPAHTPQWSAQPPVAQPPHVSSHQAHSAPAPVYPQPAPVHHEAAYAPPMQPHHAHSQPHHAHPQPHHLPTQGLAQPQPQTQPHVVQPSMGSGWATEPAPQTSMVFAAEPPTPAPATTVAVPQAVLSELMAAIRDLTQSVQNRSGEQELLNELRLMRQENNAQLHMLCLAQTQLLENFGKFQQGEWLDALKHLAAVANTQGSASGGVDMAQLNTSIGQLLDWQQRYAHTLDQTAQHHQQVVAHMQQAADQYEKMMAQAGNFVRVANQLSSLTMALENQKTSLQNMLGDFSTVVNQAGDGLPNLEAKVTALTDQLSGAIRRNQEQIHETLEAFNARAMGVMLHTEQQTREFNANIEKSVSDSLTGLGRGLAAMTQKFAEDYDQLSTALQKISAVTRRYGA